MFVPVDGYKMAAKRDWFFTRIYRGTNWNNSNSFITKYFLTAASISIHTTFTGFIYGGVL